MARKVLRLVVSVALCLGAGIAGSLFTGRSVDTWYRSLEKPFFTPPSWLFAPVWTVLYFLMGISAFLVWDKGLDKPGVKAALWIFLAQLFLNAGWPAVFFGARNIALSAAVAGFLWFAVASTMLAFSGLSRKAAFLLVPYLCWVSFALLLNAFILFLNP